jgi:hypothetical protein
MAARVNDFMYNGDFNIMASRLGIYFIRVSPTAIYSY